MNVNVRIRGNLTVAKLLVQVCVIGLLALTSAQTSAQTCAQAIAQVSAHGSPTYAIYLDPWQPLEARIADLLPRLTVTQKINQLDTDAAAIPELQIPILDGWNQCLHGVVWNNPTTMWPVSIAGAATWDPEAVHRMASAIGDEARAVNNTWKSGAATISGGLDDGLPVGMQRHGSVQTNNGLLYRAPVVNMGRDPRWGRVNEIWGEDTLLTSLMAINYMRGLHGEGDDQYGGQGFEWRREPWFEWRREPWFEWRREPYLKIAGTLKHAAVYNRETGRTSGNVVVSERFLHEYYLAQFKAGVEDGHANSIMSSYNAINGTPATQDSYLLTTILRDEIGFEGIQTPDSGAIANLVTAFHLYPNTPAGHEQAAAAAFVAGEGWDDTNAREPWRDAAYADGLITEQEIDAALTIALRIRFRLGEFDPPCMVPYTTIPPSVINSHGTSAYHMAQKAVVLLKNNNAFLPLDRSTIHTIAVSGPAANIFTAGGYSGRASTTVNPLQGIESHVAPGTIVNYVPGVTSFTSTTCDATNIAAAAANATGADVAVLFVGTTLSNEAEGRDRTAIELQPCQSQLIQAVFAANPKTVVVFQNAGAVVDTFTNANVPAILEGWWNGQSGGDAIADVLFGDYNPGGRLPYTVYASTSQLPSSTDYEISNGYTYMYVKGPVAYPFGHGLSYTQFKYKKLRIWPEELRAHEANVGSQSLLSRDLEVEVEVRNTGLRKGDEVVQVYASYPASSIPRPTKQLIAFQRITLAPHETKRVVLHVPKHILAYYDETSAAFVIAPGSYAVGVGSSSADIRLTGTFRVEHQHR